MAKPKVFISSTCYDLGEVRDSLISFVNSFGFDPVLSEHGDVFFHPDLHTHDSCIHEIGNCQLFILLIGGRFGGTYVHDIKKSITNAEYEAAVFNKIPVFTYIKKNVLDNHHLYQTNKNKIFADSIDYPAIENQNHSKLIFEFINKVRKSTINNAYEPFEVSRDIESHLRKQWAGMFFDFLKSREVNSQIESTNEAVNQIKYASSRLEDILADIYNVVDKENATNRIKQIESISLAKKYLEESIGDWQSGIIKVTKEEAEKIYSVNPMHYKWYEYLIQIGILELRDDSGEEYELWTPSKHEPEDDIYDGYIGMHVNKTELNEFQLEMERCYENGYRHLNKAEREELLSKYIRIIKTAGNKV